MPTLPLLFGVALAIVGVALVWLERRVLRSRGSLESDADSDPNSGTFVRSRSIRRLRIGFLILFLGAAVIAGDGLDPHAHPLAYIGTWTCAALISIALVRLATIDYIASRRHFSGELERSVTELARARAELKRRLGPDSEALD